MERKIKKDDINKRVILTDMMTGISRTEAEIWEISPSGKYASVAIRNSPNVPCWIDIEEYRILEELPEKPIRLTISPTPL